MNYVVNAVTQDIHTITLNAKDGANIVLTNAGAAIVALWVPDKERQLGNVVLGYENIEQYLNNDMALGATIGRHAGRIEQAQICINGAQIQLPANEGPHLLHGNFSSLLWNYEIIERADDISVVFTLHSDAGSDGFPGNVDVNVTMTFNEAHELRIDYDALSDAKTVLNLTNHSYFNLSGHPFQPIGDHLLEVKSDYYLELAEDSIPTYAKATRNSSFDFSEPQLLAHLFDKDDVQLTRGGGLDNPFHLLPQQPQIRLVEPHVGRVLTVETSYPFAVIYSGNNIDETAILTEHLQAKKQSAICFETQLAPYSHFKKRFDAELAANQRYHYTTNFRFTTL